MMSEPIEPELLTPAPRPVRRRVRLDANDWWQRVSALLVLGALGGFIAWQGRDVIPHYLFNGAATGVIERLVIPERESAYVTYRYPVERGEAEGRQVVTFEQRALLQPGTKVPVRILRVGSRRFSALEAASPQGFAILFSGGLILFAALVILGFQYGWPRVQRRLFSTGVPARGLITGHATFTRRGSTNHYIHYEFTTEAGRLIRTKMIARKADYERAKAGQPATVLYAGGFPRHNLLYDYAEFTCRT